MPEIVRRALQWVRIDRRRIYAFGGSMGGQEVLLLAARHPRLVAGVAAFDASTDLRARYYAFARIRCWRRCPGGGRAGARLQALAREEVGGSPRRRFSAYAARSPVTYAGALARSGVPLQLWWSVSDGVVVDGRGQSGRLYRRIHRANPSAPVVEFIGRWMHSEDMRYTGKLRIALARFGLLRARDVAGTCGMVGGPRNTLERIAPDVRPPLACLMFQPKPKSRPRPKPKPKPKPEPTPQPSGRPWPSPQPRPPPAPAEPYAPSPPPPGGKPMTDGSVTGA